ncbi:conserved hypothetical protein [Clostridium neonatale]|uniref:hypothetical protein n=1 Tax=Clostridium neonatale TaxID=137838 RepID=UPI001D5BB705|nr:hypothetical protein [Clostridium neonatale]CAG9702595.1 conserved hypothetical protein [Clostridium neonatale]
MQIIKWVAFIYIVIDLILSFIGIVVAKTTEKRGANAIAFLFNAVATMALFNGIFGSI